MTRRAIGKSRAIMALNDVVADCESVIQRPKDHEYFKKWRSDCLAVVRNIFGAESPQYKELDDIRYGPLVFSTGTPDSVFEECRTEGIQLARGLLTSMRDEIDRFWDEPDGPSMRAVLTNKPQLKIFVSHSSKDANLAEAVVDLVKNALGLTVADIRCTSVDGYKLPAGTPATERLKLEVEYAEVLIALFSRNALDSTFTLFELGARWALARPLIPVRAGGFEPNELPGPLRDVHAPSLHSRPDVLQLVDDLSKYLAATPCQHSSWDKYVEAVIQASKVDKPADRAIAPPQFSPKEPRPSKLSEKQLAVLTEIGKYNEGRGVDFQTLMKNLQLDSLLLRHILNQLENDRYLNVTHTVRALDEPTRYRLSDKGVAILVEQRE